MAEASNQSTVRVPAPGGVITAKPSRDYRWRRYVLALVIFGWGIWSIYDGFYQYPRQNAEFKKLNPELVYIPHPGLDVPLNKVFGIVMPPLSVLFLAWVFYNSRGEYQFDGQTLTVPGHPPVPVSSIVKIDRAKWERKGIAYLHYQAAGSSSLGVLRLDDFIYDRVPTDEIYKRIDKVLTPTAGPV